MKSVVYSATRQWNPGDEFILQGTIRLMKAAIGEHNAILYNRHPGLRPLYGEGRFRRVRQDWSSGQVNELEKDFKIGFFDNSVKFDTDLGFADYAVIAGSPECFNPRTENFYRHVAESSLPLLALGVGHVDDVVPEWILSIFRKSLLTTVRAEKVGAALESRCGVSALRFPCPALFCVACGEEKNIESVRRVALVFGASSRDSIPCQEIADDACEFTTTLFRALIERFRDRLSFSIVCHYIDELPAAFREFGDCGIDIRYSYDAQEYANIYRAFDLVVSPRVHGCGIASSLGIPSIHVSHDVLRSDTAEGFHARMLSTQATLDEAIDAFRDRLESANTTNASLIEYKAAAFKEYVDAIRKALKDAAPVRYDAELPPEPAHFARTPADVLAELAPARTTDETGARAQGNARISIPRRIWNRLIGKRNS